MAQGMPQCDLLHCKADKAFVLSVYLFYYYYCSYIYIFSKSVGWKLLSQFSPFLFVVSVSIISFPDSGFHVVLPDKLCRASLVSQSGLSDIFFLIVALTYSNDQTDGFDEITKLLLGKKQFNSQKLCSHYSGKCEILLQAYNQHCFIVCQDPEVNFCLCTSPLLPLIFCYFLNTVPQSLAFSPKYFLKGNVVVLSQNIGRDSFNSTYFNPTSQSIHVSLLHPIIVSKVTYSITVPQQIKRGSRTLQESAI